MQALSQDSVWIWHWRVAFKAAQQQAASTEEPVQQFWTLLERVSQCKRQRILIGAKQPEGCGDLSLVFMKSWDKCHIRLYHGDASLECDPI